MIKSLEEIYNTCLDNQEEFNVFTKELKNNKIRFIEDTSHHEVKENFIGKRNIENKYEKL